METLNFSLPEFVRMSWVSQAARQVWEPRLHKITAAWQEIEWRSVVAGVRNCAVVTASPEQFIARAAAWARQGLNSLPVDLQASRGNSYAASSSAPQPGQPFLFRIVLGRPLDTAEFQSAWEDSDHAAMGALLGYPDCCTQFFQRVWVELKLRDTTWPMALATVQEPANDHFIQVSGDPEANILWRWMGIRAASHLPCRFDCQPSRDLARKLIEVGRSEGYAEEMDWMLEILSWPVEWTALHGIAEIKTPLMRVSTQTDATPDKYVVQRLSQAYPQEGALGAAFPFKRMPAKERLSRSRREVVKQPRQPASREEHPWLAADNGFASSANMETAHQPIIALALEALAGRPGCVLDLGCGNGALLKKIQEGNPSLEIYGLDWEDIRIEHARQLMPGLADHFAAGNMFSSEWPWQAQRRYLLAILMPGRFLEVNAESRQFLRTCLQQYCDQLLVYAYDDWLQQYGGLGKLAQAAGFELPETRSEARVSLARCV